MDARPLASVLTETATGSVDTRPRATGREIRWTAGDVELTIGTPVDAPPHIARLRARGVALEMSGGLALLDVMTVADGHVPSSDRLTHGGATLGLRYAGHREDLSERGWPRLVVALAGAGGLCAEVRFSLPPGGTALHVDGSVSNASTWVVHVLRSVTTVSSRLGVAPGAAPGVGDWRLEHARSDWLGEGRWTEAPLRGGRLVPLEEHLTGHDPRGALRVVSNGTWSTGRFLPTAVLTSARHRAAWAWQIEHNGGWRWEVGEDTADGWFALSGPTDDDHQWTGVLQPGDRFDVVPVALALAEDSERAIAELTRYRRAARRPHPDNAAMPVIFNDYMNTLNGDPTTEKLLPLIDAASAVGAEIFCIDAGWYADGDWWDSVGEWLPSTARFPGGLAEVTDHIRAQGMTPGLWLEPEVVGVQSPIAERLPDAAFLQRHGQRIVEHQRYHLDLRHPAARAHLDAVVDRLVEDFGIGYFKLDYNIDPGPGTDLDAPSAGAGLLAHNRAHLAWLEGVLDRHPDLVLENCGSGAMRADFAMLSRLQLQSTSDQQDFERYPPIAASAPASMLPEQAASWAYPQPGMSMEEAAFCLATGLPGRFFLSGYLNEMDGPRLALVADAVDVAKGLRGFIRSAVPFWPTGRPGWDDDVVVLGLECDGERLLVVWDRRGGAAVDLPLQALAGIACSVSTVFPTSLTPWTTAWEAESGTFRAQNPGASLGARVFRITASTADDRPSHHGRGPRVPDKEIR